MSKTIGYTTIGNKVHLIVEEKGEIKVEETLTKIGDVE